ncbi:MAG: hypothetical protein P8X63_07855 [Desulfuromonadaceae bacterium]|jgi:phosphate transport system permease protein
MNRKVLRRIKLRDRIARWVITIGGLAIIGCVILILLLIGNVTLPLFQKPSAKPLATIDLPQTPEQKSPLAVDIDEYLQTAVILTTGGRFYLRLRPGSLPAL